MSIPTLPVSNPANLRLWVNALRSGHYKQTTGRLLRKLPILPLDPTSPLEPCYCCLGVMCDLADPCNDTGWQIYSVPEIDRLQFIGADTTSSPPYVLIPSTLHDVLTGARSYANVNDAYSVVKLNDILHFTFSQIADCIEYTYLRLTGSCLA